MVKLYNQLTTKEYIKEVYRPGMTIYDLEEISKYMGVTLIYVQKCFNELKLPYITARELARMKRIEYLQEVWCKEPIDNAMSLGELSEKLKACPETIRKEIRIAGLDDYFHLTVSKVISRNSHNYQESLKQKNREENFKKLCDLYEDYQKNGTRYTYEEIFLNLNETSITYLKDLISGLGFKGMIKEPVEKCSLGKRKTYYINNREYLIKHANIAQLAVKFGISYGQVLSELKTFKILQVNSSNLDILLENDSEVDNRFGRLKNRMVSEEDGHLSYENLNKLLGKPKGTYTPEY